MIQYLSSRFIHRLKKITPFVSNKITKGINSPLLNDEEMTELSRIAQNKKNFLKQHRDVAHSQSGSHRSMFSGQGMDYEESRLYQSSDDPRLMNWQLTAKTGRYFMKIFREERQPGVFILVDRRSAMCFGTQQRLKVTQAARTAALVTFIAQQENLCIGGAILEDNIEWFKISNDKQAAINFVHRASRPVIPVPYRSEVKEVDLNAILKKLNVMLTKGTIVYLISDFIDLNDKSRSALVELTTHHQVHAFMISDPAESSLPGTGKIALKSSPQSKAQIINTSAPYEKQSYETAATKYFSDIKNIFESSAVNFKKILTTADNIDSQLEFRL